MSLCEESLASDLEPVMVVRQPIFGRDKDIWGYELLASGVPTASDGGGTVSLAEFMDGFQGYFSGKPCESLIQGKRFLLNIPEGVCLTGEAVPEGWEKCVFGICQSVADPDCRGFAESVRSGGGCVALTGNVVPESDFDALLEKGDIIKVSLEGKTPPEIVNIRHKYRGFKGKLLITDVNSWEAFEGTRALGFSYFQGTFFSIPQLEEDLKLPANSVSKLQLLRELGNPDCEMDELAAIIASDVSLSYRILKYINSASFGLKNKIKSIQQAVSLLGLNEVRHWSTVVVMTDLDSTPKGEELSYRALQRGRFLSKLTESMSDFDYSANTMFMLGLFSKLDALLSYPMDKALENIPLNDEIKDGLCGTLNEYRDWLLLLEAVELGNWQIADDILRRYGACLTAAATQYMNAASWAEQHLPQMKG